MKKIDDYTFFGLLASGAKQCDIAAALGVTRSAVCKRIQKGHRKDLDYMKYLYTLAFKDPLVRASLREIIKEVLDERKTIPDEN